MRKWLAAIVLCFCALGMSSAQQLVDTPGRSEIRVRAGLYPLRAGRDVQQMRLAERLERLDYARVHQKPERAGEFFWGHKTFWIFRRAFRHGGREHRARLIVLALEESSGRVLGRVSPEPDKPIQRLGTRDVLEPELLSESLDARRALRHTVRLQDLPEQVWRPVLAAEDSRFFEHHGIDSRSIARAMLANAKAGGVVQGGSTITQQLVKNRSLTPKRSLGRKVSEAMRALALETEYDKKEILEAYLNSIYWGHLDGLAIHGISNASRAYFSKAAADLNPQQAATLAGMIQGPNLHHPVKHPERAKKRRDWVLSRMEVLEWMDAASAERARKAPLGIRRGNLRAPPARHFLSWIAAIVKQETGDRLEKGKGVIVETTLDPLLQQAAEESVESSLKSLRKSYSKLRKAPLSAALVAVDVRNGDILAYVGGDPGARGDNFDRARNAHRQPGSTIKPLLLLEAFEDCGDHQALTPASRIADEVLSIQTPSGPWEPKNYSGRFHGTVSIRQALRKSYNVPFVRLARYCGFETTAKRIRRAGLLLGAQVPPSFALGSVEVTPLELARAFSLFPGAGRTMRPRPLTRIEKPSGWGLETKRIRRRRVVDDSTAYLVHDLLRDVVDRGTGRNADLKSLEVAGKTGSSSGLRDAWFAGYAGSVLTVVWVGLDNNNSLGLTGSVAAAPIFRRFTGQAVPARPPHVITRPRSVRTHRVDPETGLLVSDSSRNGYDELFRRAQHPRRDRWWRKDQPEAVIR